MIDQINELITQNLGPQGGLMIVGLLGVLLILITLPILLQKQEDPLEKLKKQQRAQVSEDGQAAKLRAGSNKKSKLEKYSTFLEPQDAEEFSAVKLKLLQAGYRSKNAVQYYHFSQFALGIVGLIIGGILVILKTNQAGDEGLTTQAMAMWGVGPGAAGYMFPKYWVTRRVDTRKEAIEQGFPDSLDMMLVCVEAGQSLDQSIIRVARELQAGFPDLAWEYELVAHEMKAGKAKEQVLRDMSERCGVQDITSFVTVLIQSQQFGTSIADALRVYASEMRDKRVMRAEEKANKLPTKMTLATMMLTVPPLLVILIGPSIYNISQNLGGV
ncbi:tight adherence protein C [Cognatiyoonia sediminum]|uniref:Tight adherence protein C n=1 Tax=Cognatiyoonia sediminum TaxID=1508389 RepID=A0A1M5NDG9_9RHOB|nr:type II secretion system F family protein [Cognatiyoonia sediminum]SHG87239.1 tight adherence protein C [Cognatiyoonia sediminum]